MLAIEVDGSSHDVKEIQENDQFRQYTLESMGISFIRFSDREVNRDIENVIRALQDKVDELKASNTSADLP